MTKKPKQSPKQEKIVAEMRTVRNTHLHIPLDFEKAVEGLLNTKSQSKKIEKPNLK